MHAPEWLGVDDLGIEMRVRSRGNRVVRFDHGFRQVTVVETALIPKCRMMQM